MESSNNNKQPTPPPSGNNQIPLFGGKESFTDATKPKRSIQNKNRGTQNKNLLQNAKVERHEKGIQKYKHYEDLNRNKDLVEEMMKGEKKEVYIPKAGEYVVITADKKADKTRVLDIPIMELLDATKSFTELKEKHQDGTFQRLNSPLGRAQTAGRSRVGESMVSPPGEDRQPLNTYNENIAEMGEGEGETGRSETDYSTHLTRNLKTITKRQAQGTLIPSNVILSNIVSERVHTETETANPSRLTGRLPSAQPKPGTAVSGRRIHSSHALRFGRPESANFVAQKLVGSLTDTGGDIQDEIKKYKEQTQPKAGPGKAKTTYQVRPKYSGRPQHITGHSTIKDSEIDYRKPIIEPPKERPITSPFMSGVEAREFKKDKKKKDDGKSGYFLPLEYYFFDEEDGKTISPQELIERYRDPGSEKTFAFSKWFYPDGKFIWCKCEIQGYDKEYDRYLIKWIHNNNEKKVSRVNLRFELESEEEFNDKIEAAEVYRLRSEIFLKYNYLIDSMNTPTHRVSEEIKDRIMNFVLGHPFKLGPLRDPIQFLTVPAYVRFNSKYYLIPKLIDIPPKTIVERFKKKSYNLELLNTLVEEVDKEYVRANHQIEFDSTLPYSEERQVMFRGTLEDDMFITLKEKGTPETDAKGLLQIPYEFPHKYENLILHLRKRLHQAAPDKIRLLLTLNNDLVRYENTLLVLNKFPQTEGVQLLDFIKLQQETLNNFLRDFKGRMFDTYYEISEMVEIELQNMRKRNEERLRTIALETERRLAEEKELPPDVAHSLKSYQSLVNTLFERSVRGTFERSFIKLYEQFSYIVNYFNKHITEEEKKLTPENVEAKTFDYESLYKFQTQAEYERPYESAPHLSTLLTADDEGHFELFPSPGEVYKKTKEYIEYVKDNLMNVECLRAKEIGPARESGYLDIILREDIFYAEYTTMLYNTVQMLMEIPTAFLEKLKGFKSLCNIQKEKVKSKLKKLNFSEFKKKLAKLKSNQQELERVLYKDTLKAGLVLIDVKSVKERLVKNVDVLLQIYFKTLIFKIGQENTQLKKDVDEILQTLKKDPTNLEELNDLRKYASDLPKYVESTINVKIADIMDKLNLLEDMRYKISYADFESSWSSFGLPMRVEYKADKCLRRLVQMERKFSDDLMEQQNQLLLEIQEIRQQLDILTKEGNYNRYDQMSNEFAQLGDRIERTQREVEVVNRRELLLKWKLNDYTEIEKIKKEWQPYNKVWNLAIEYHIRVMDVLNGPIFAVDRDVITTEIIESWNELFKLEKQTFKLVPHMLGVTQTVRLMYEDFKPNLPLINDLRNPALKPRHWQKISEVTGVEFDQESNVLSLKTLLDSGIMQYKDQINEISEIASKEQSFERLLNKMKNDWKNIKFELVEFRNTETYILRQLEPILDKLDEDLTKTMSIASSPFIKFLENDVNAWKNTLVKAQDIIDIWVKVQKLWQYLQPIFFSEDILVQMPKAGVKYQQADKIWRSIMENVFKYPNVLETCATHKIRDNFGLALDLLEEVIKGLNDYLNKKRAAFPRFYFLSNDELLSILAQTREPKAVQKHLSKCFEGIEYLTFEEDLSITAMNSIEDERIGFSKPINPLDKEGVPRNVEEWLADVEKTMKSSLREVFHKSLLAYSDKTRKKWLFDWPAQIVVLCDQTLWTSQVEKAIDATKADTKSLEKCFDEQNRLLLEVVDLLKMDISKRDRITLGVLIVIEVHAKDVIEELVRNEVKSVQAFEWLAQMRYNYEMDKLSLNVAMVNTVRKYGYEYLGNQARLVITPLTDRCYRTLMSALQMNLGGAPEGPAGTGKTETTKDLAKALAKHCVVFNCSEALDYTAMGKFFKGLCACGSWACFDEFNRIELEVLSVIAQQILSIQNALIRGSKSFMFEDAMIPLEPSCAVFITMNPGYAGRSELPDNLKALFRPVAMMIPNYAMIAEISLYSYGFTDARALSIKITTSLKLSSEQLSSQSHYDFGMRAVKSIILAAGALKRAFPNDPNEAMLVLRAIKECNVPKFTTSDVPLFNAILSDLFPKAVLEDKDYGFLKKGIEEICVEKNYSLTSKFFVKIMELYETIQVRHGLMVVGATMCGKSSITKVLSNAIERASTIEKTTKLIAEGKTEEEIVNTKIDGTKVKTYSLNPKSVTIQMLYGAVDPASNEWRDGITADIFRECKEDATKNLKWIIFDGPVDALWIENMNTVLDDNKKLCLMSGETIKLTDEMSIIFEVEDLLEASPATVSRCGMVFMESTNLEWTSLFDRWKANIPSTHMNEEFEKMYNEMNKYILVPIIELFQSNKIKTLLNVYITWVINMFLKALEAYIFKNKTRVDIQREIEVEKQKHLAKMAAMRLEGKEMPKQAGSDVKALNPKEKTEVFACYISALIWSFSSIMDEKSKVEFERVLREAANKACEDSTVLTEVGKEGKLPVEQSIYEMFYDFEKKSWQGWIKHLTEFKLPEDIKFHEVYIPTLENLQNTSFLYQMVTHDFPVLFIGKTGTGKTTCVKKLLLNDLDQNAFIPTITVFSANTTCVNAQDVLESKLEKQKRRKGIYGPVVGFTNIIFIDDLNMPAKEKYGAQPPLELIRQWLDYGGWYDRKSLEFKTIADIQFLASMGVGRAPISNRLIRHFNIVYLNEMSDDTLKMIVRKTLDWGFSRYIDKVKFMTNGATNIIFKTYKEIQTSKAFLPLPSKSHYIFNMRDMLKVVQGILSVPPPKYEATADNKTKILRLLIHESICVYSDRLVNKEDKDLFVDVLREKIKEEYSLDLDSILDDTHLLYGNFMEMHAQEKEYQEIEDKEKLISTVEEYIAEYNSLSKSNKINVYLFDEAIALLIKINRIIASPFGNALLVGLGGSGRHTMCRLATYMQDYIMNEIEMEKELTPMEWYEFQKKMLRTVGVENKPVVFLASDSQIRDDRYFEDINSLLNIGEIPNLFTADEKEAMIAEIKEIIAKENKENREKRNLSPLAIWEYFVNNCKINLHIVLAMSPIGEKLRVRLRNFPSLVSCTSLLWVLPWSDGALSSVATSFLRDSTNIELTQEQKTSVSNICVEFHLSVNEASKKFKAELGRNFYVTPISYMQLLQNLERLLLKKQQDSLGLIKKYESGILKLEQCTEVVESTKLELEDLKPKLNAKEKETEDIIKDIEVETTEAEKTKIIVMADEEETSKKAASAGELQAQCQEKLSEALPGLEAAIKALKTLKTEDFVEMKATLNKPPIPVRKTMEAVCIMLGKFAKDSEGYMTEAKKQVAEPKKLMERLENFPRDNIPDKVIDKLGQFLKENPNFKPEFVANASNAAKGLCLWVLALHKYSLVNKAITPLKEDLKLANDTLQAASDELAKKRAALREIEDKILGLRMKFEQANLEKQTLKAQKVECEIKLERAFQLTSGLGSERERWGQEAQRLRRELSNLLGDILLAVGSISYLGAFTGKFREQIITEKWIKKIRQENIVCSEGFTLQSTIGNPIEIQDWILQGLPLDSVSIDNAIYMKESTLWPLIIDPQKQATKFIKNKEFKEREALFFVTKPSDNIARTLEHVVRMGGTLLVENVGEQIDPIFDPVLQKAIYVSGGIKFINIGNQPVEYSKDFRLYLVSNLNNPHYLPEVLTKVTLLNFTITYEGLKDQMLSIVAKEEEPKDEDEKIKLMFETSADKAKKKMLEDKILELLATSEGKILENEVLIKSLTESKSTSEEIEVRLKHAKVTEDRINTNRANYEPVAVRASHLFLTILQLSNLDPMYQYSLEWFIKNFLKTIKLAEKPAGRNLKLRVKNLLDTLCKQIYREVTRSVFEKHKLLFAFLITTTVLRIDEALDHSEWMLLLTGLSGQPIPDVPNPDPVTFSESTWEAILHLSNLPKFNGLGEQITNNLEEWKEYLNDIENRKAPAPYEALEPFRVLSLIKVLRPDLFVAQTRKFITDVLGDYFISPHVFTLDDSFKESTTPLVPLVFILSPGDDPLEELRQFAQEKSRTLVPLSLGKGQGEFAAKQIKEGIAQGTWVLLQNCHLAASWMKSLEDIVENLPKELQAKRLHESFRLWLTTASSDVFPSSLLQTSVKMTKDPPTGVKANLMQIYNGIQGSKAEKDFFYSCQKQEEWRKLFLALGFFHAIIRERKRYGPIGWNIKYDFNMSDFKISMKQLHHMLNSYQEVPFQALIYLTGECYYGGRVTDDWDRRTLITLLKDFYNPYASEGNYTFSSVKEFVIPEEDMDLPNASQFSEELPNNEPPELFGLHSNAEITSNLNEANMILTSILAISPKTVGQGAGDQNKKLIAQTEEFLQSLPADFDIDKVSQVRPNNYYESMNTVLLQELARYNNLLRTIRNSLKQLIQAMGGFIVMSSDLENMAESLTKNLIPQNWARRSYPSLKPLSGYFKDLLQRLKVLQDWIDFGQPVVYWLSGFYFPQSFLTGVLQNYARAKTIPIDQLRFDFSVLKDGEAVEKAPETGCYITGLFLEGATWDSERGVLEESPYKVLYKIMPTIQFIPTEEVKDYNKIADIYTCPVYKTSDRRGTLSTTGHSTNFILPIYLKSEKPKEWWVKRGVAMITQLNE